MYTRGAGRHGRPSRRRSRGPDGSPGARPAESHDYTILYYIMICVYIYIYIYTHSLIMYTHIVIYVPQARFPRSPACGVAQWCIRPRYSKPGSTRLL